MQLFKSIPQIRDEIFPYTQYFKFVMYIYIYIVIISERLREVTLFVSCHFYWKKLFYVGGLLPCLGEKHLGEP